MPPPRWGTWGEVGCSIKLLILQSNSVKIQEIFNLETHNNCIRNTGLCRVNSMEERVVVLLQGGLAAMPCRNGLMGANELGMCHHNGERTLVHLGARVPMQPVDRRERVDDGRRSDEG